MGAAVHSAGDRSITMDIDKIIAYLGKQVEFYETKRDKAVENGDYSKAAALDAKAEGLREALAMLALRTSE